MYSLNGVNYSRAPVLSGVPREPFLDHFYSRCTLTILYTLLTGNSDFFAVFATVKIKEREHTVKLKENKDRLGYWANGQGLEYGIPANQSYAI